MNKTTCGKDVCSHKHSFILDNFIRRLFQRPGRIVGEYISPGDTVIDLGCGPGFFTIEMAKKVGEQGKVIAVDLQKEMLEKVRCKAEKLGLFSRVQLHQCAQDQIGLANDVKADFILAFYMVHETPDQKAFLAQTKSLLKPDGRLLIVEPRFHVSRGKFSRMQEDAAEAGFTILDMPEKKGGWSLLLSISGKADR